MDAVWRLRSRQKETFAGWWAWKAPGVGRFHRVQLYLDPIEGEGPCASEALFSWSFIMGAEFVGAALGFAWRVVISSGARDWAAGISVDANWLASMV